jgi:hypothetical protein
MAFPKKIKKDLKLTPEKILLDRRKELLEYIQEDGTYLPKSVLHADLDRGMLDFVRDDLEMVADGKKVNPIDIITTTQNWSQFTETWNFQDLDKNIKPPFIATVRQPEVKYGTNPSLQYTIPNRKQFYYAKVPTWDGQRKGMDIYKIPQPVPVDITYNVKIFCTKMRHLNEFNKLVLQKFSSRQAYTFVKGHYVPIILNNVSDESVLDIEKRKYYIQNYEFLMMGFLIDENEFEVLPAITRALTLFEVETGTKSRRAKKEPPNPENFDLDILFRSGINSLSERYPYTIDLTFMKTKNILQYSIYINDNFIGDDLKSVNINTNDVIRINVVKNDPSLDSIIRTQAHIPYGD